MKDAAEYLSQIKALIVFTTQVLQWEIVREESQGDAGLFRYRLRLSNDSLLELFELFQIVEGKVEVRKYSFHYGLVDQVFAGMQSRSMVIDGERPGVWLYRAG